MNGYSEFIVSSNELLCQDVIYKDILIRGNTDALVMGTVFDAKGDVIGGALIIIKKIGNMQDTGKIIGFTVANEKGNFAFIVKREYGVDYQFDIYEPMVSNLKWGEDECG